MSLSKDKIIITYIINGSKTDRNNSRMVKEIS